MSNQRPYKAIIEEQGYKIRLLFDAGSPVSSGVYILRGGLAWPDMTPDGLKGAVVLLARSVRTGVIWAVEAMEFHSLDDILSADRSQVEFRGLVPWMVKIWADYRADTFYCHQAADMEKAQRIRLHRLAGENNIQPYTPHVEWASEAVQVQALTDLIAQGRFRMPRGGLVSEALRDNRAKPEEWSPVLHATLAAAAGMERITD